MGDMRYEAAGTLEAAVALLAGAKGTARMTWAASVRLP